MKNLEQIRAQAALKATEEKSGNNPQFTRADVAGFPGMIISNGLLAAFAYATEDGKDARKGIKFACDKTAEHLGTSSDISILNGKKTAKDFISVLTSEKATSLDLQRATSETLAFFAYLKRFAKKD